MAKQLLTSYAFVPGAANAGTITVPGTYALNQFLLVTNVTAGVVIYQFNAPAKGAALNVAGGSTTLTLEFSTATMNAGDSLQIFADSTTGSSANTVLSGSGAPASGTGSDGDFYIDTAATRIYGPRASGAWGSGTSLVGAAGVVSATAPITYNSGTQSVAINAATTAAAGSMSSSDKAKLDAITGTNTGDQTITLTGEVTGSGTGSFAATVANSAVIGKVLTGYTSAAGTVSATDSILQAIQKLNGNDAAFLTSSTAATTYQPLDADLTAIAALSTASAGRSLLTLAAVPSGALVGTTDTQTLSAKTLGSLQEALFTITDAAAFEINPANGPIQTITLGANRTPAANNFASGQSVKLKIDDGTAYAITWTTVNVVWIGQTAGASGTAPTLGTTGWTHIELWKEGSLIYGALIGYSAT
jgi:hypothetical protein